MQMRFSHACFQRPCPPNLGLSRQLGHSTQSLRMQPAQAPHRCRLGFQLGLPYTVSSGGSGGAGGRRLLLLDEAASGGPPGHACDPGLSTPAYPPAALCSVSTPSCSPAKTAAAAAAPGGTTVCVRNPLTLRPSMRRGGRPDWPEVGDTARRTADGSAVGPPSEGCEDMPAPAEPPAG